MSIWQKQHFLKPLYITLWLSSHISSHITYIAFHNLLLCVINCWTQNVKFIFQLLCSFGNFDFNNGQLKPLKTVANKITLSHLILNLPISWAMQQFLIKEQHRCSATYQKFLGKYGIPFSLNYCNTAKHY